MTERSEQLPDKVLYSSNPNFTQGAFEENSIQKPEDSIILSDQVGFNVVKAVRYARKFGGANSRQRNAVMRELMDQPDVAAIINSLQHLSDPEQGIARLEDYGPLTGTVLPKYAGRLAREEEQKKLQAAQALAQKYRKEPELQFYGMEELPFDAITWRKLPDDKRAQYISKKAQDLLGNSGKHNKSEELMGIFLLGTLKEDAETDSVLDKDPYLKSIVGSYCQEIINALSDKRINVKKLDDEDLEKVLSTCINIYDDLQVSEGDESYDDFDSQRLNRAKRIVKKLLHESSKESMDGDKAVMYAYILSMNGVIESNIEDETHQLCVDIVEGIILNYYDQFLGGIAMSRDSAVEQHESTDENLAAEILMAMHIYGKDIYTKFANRAFMPKKDIEEYLGGITLSKDAMKLLEQESIKSIADKEDLDSFEVLVEVIFGFKPDDEVYEKLRSGEINTFWELAEYFSNRPDVNWQKPETNTPGPLMISAMESVFSSNRRNYPVGSRLYIYAPGDIKYMELPKKGSTISISDYIYREYTNIITDGIELTHAGYIESLGLYDPEEISFEQSQALKNETDALIKNIKESGDHFVSARGDRINISDEILKNAGFEEIRFFKDPNNKKHTKVNLKVLGHSVWLAITPELELVNYNNHEDILHLSGGSKEYLRHIIISYYHDLRCNYRVESGSGESGWRDQEGTVVTFRRGHLRRQGYKPSKEQVELALEEQDFDLLADVKERRELGLPIRTYVRELTNPYLQSKPMKVSAPKATRHIEKIVRSS